MSDLTDIINSVNAIEDRNMVNNYYTGSSTKKIPQDLIDMLYVHLSVYQSPKDKHIKYLPHKNYIKESWVFPIPKSEYQRIYSSKKIGLKQKMKDAGLTTENKLKEYGYKLHVDLLSQEHNLVDSFLQRAEEPLTLYRKTDEEVLAEIIYKQHEASKTGTESDDPTMPRPGESMEEYTKRMMGYRITSPSDIAPPSDITSEGYNPTTTSY